MMNWIMRMGLKWHKYKVLLEVRKDMEFLHTMKGDKLSFDEEDARAQLVAIRKNEEMSDEDKDRKESEISKLIHSSQAVKAEYELKAQMEVDLMNYIDLI